MPGATDDGQAEAKSAAEGRRDGDVGHAELSDRSRIQAAWPLSRACQPAASAAETAAAARGGGGGAFIYETTREIGRAHV